MFGDKLRTVRENKGLLLRQVAAHLEVDTAFMSKLERGEKKATKEQMLKLAAYLQIKEKDLYPLWLSDKIIEVIDDSVYSEEALKLTIKRIKKTL